MVSKKLWHTSCTFASARRSQRNPEYCEEHSNPCHDRTPATESSFLCPQDAPGFPLIHSNSEIGDNDHPRATAYLGSINLKKSRKILQSRLDKKHFSFVSTIPFFPQPRKNQSFQVNNIRYVCCSKATHKIQHPGYLGQPQLHFWTWFSIFGIPLNRQIQKPIVTPLCVCRLARLAFLVLGRHVWNPNGCNLSCGCKTKPHPCILKKTRKCKTHP